MKVKKLLLGLICFCVVCGFAHAQTLGDTNGDGSINIIDALVIARHYVGLNPQPFYPDAADVAGCDGTVDIIDALTIAQFYVQSIDMFPCSRELNNFTIMFTRIGGIAGIEEEIIIRSEEKTLSLNGRTKELGDLEISLLWDALSAMDYSSLPNDLSPCCCDQFNYEMTITSTLPRINGITVFTDCTFFNDQVPPELVVLLDLIYLVASDYT